MSCLAVKLDGRIVFEGIIMRHVACSCIVMAAENICIVHILSVVRMPLLCTGFIIPPSWLAALLFLTEP